jgi:hypothetical protein
LQRPRGQAFAVEVKEVDKRRRAQRQTRARTNQFAAGKTTPCDVACPLK